MRKSKSGFKSLSKKTTLIAIATVVVVAGLAVGAFFLFGKKELSPAEKKKAEQTAAMKELGSEFYTDFWYKLFSEGKSQEEIDSYLSDYKKGGVHEKGISTNLDNLHRTAAKDGSKKKAENLKGGDNNCDDKETKVFIYPKTPYGKNDFTIEVKLDCGKKASEKE